MAVSILSEITGQEVTALATYCYLYEPLRVVVQEGSPDATKFYIDVSLYNVSDGVIEEVYLEYAVYDIARFVSISVDLMEIVKQINSAKAYKYGNVSNITDFGDGYKTTITDFKYEFKIYSDLDSVGHTVSKLPIIGGRQYNQFTPEVLLTTPTNEFEFYGIDTTEIDVRWGSVHFIKTVLVDPTGTNVRPLLTKISPTGIDPCGGFLVWKSRFGGWMYWGFDLKQENFSHIYNKKLDVGFFESTEQGGGDPYVPVDYTGIETSRSITLKSLGLSQEELWAMSGIKASPAIYYQEVGSENIELMRLASASIPLNNLANGGDFSVSLKSISKASQLTA